MPWYVWALIGYGLLSAVIGAGSAWVAWDYDPLKTFFVVALSWPVLVLAWAVG